ncbi:hypothetical protein DFS34DRAFT_36912 [Phlyctochytrium arcticum]|nr:hypothetical protein DFS34DRAFT_36912 [Phlyctochytrium arcticum]
MGKKRFIDPKKSVHYQVVHRSQRDPAVADEASSTHVLKPIAPSYNLLKKGQYNADELAEPLSDADDLNGPDGDSEGGQFSSADEEDTEIPELHADDSGDDENPVTLKSAKSDLKGAVADKKGKSTVREEASMHGIFFDDQDKYDYLKHLKIVGEDPSGVVMEAKNTRKEKPTAIKFVDEEEEKDSRRKVTFQIPAAALPSAQEDRVGMLNRSDPSFLEVAPDVREVLYALDDEAYVDEAADDDFFAALDGDELPDDYVEEVKGPSQTTKGSEGQAGEEEWYHAYRKYKKGEHEEDSADGTDDSDDEDRKFRRSDGWERRTAETSFSVMSSSTMFRNDKLTLLDDQFDRVIDEYSDEEIGELDGEDPNVRGDNLVSRTRLEGIFDDFLDETEVIGHKKRLVPRVIGKEVMDSVRDDLRENAKEALKMYEEGREYKLKKGEKVVEMLEPEEKVYDTWDVETVLTTYSNIYNRPKLIGEIGKGRKIRLQGRMGLPVLEDEAVSEKENEDGDEEGDEEEPVNKGVARSKQETKEEKRQRKQEIKEERRNRRGEKKATKTAFKEEGKRQLKVLPNVLAQEKNLHVL